MGAYCKRCYSTNKAVFSGNLSKIKNIIILILLSTESFSNSKILFYTNLNRNNEYIKIILK